MSITPVPAAASPATTYAGPAQPSRFDAPAAHRPGGERTPSTAETVSGGGLGLHLSIPIPKVLVWAGLGALAGAFIPPLAPLGAVGGAIAGAAIGLIL